MSLKREFLIVGPRFLATQRPYKNKRILSLLVDFVFILKNINSFLRIGENRESTDCISTIIIALGSLFIMTSYSRYILMCLLTKKYALLETIQKVFVITRLNLNNKHPLLIKKRIVEICIIRGHKKASYSELTSYLKSVKRVNINFKAGNIVRIDY